MLKVIRGDTLNLTITVEKGAELIEELWFSSGYLNIVKQCTKINDNQYVVNLDSELTCDCKLCNTTYDITAKLKDNQINTIVYNDEIRVYKKDNAIDGN